MIDSGPTVSANGGFEAFSVSDIQHAMQNILEDFDAEKGQLSASLRAMQNILEDFNTEKSQLSASLRAMQNILEDFDGEKVYLQDSQRALLNILEDVELEKAQVGILNRQLESAIRELESFSYSVSHDLRAPLRSIDGFSRILLEDFEDDLPPQAQRYLRLVRSNTQQMGLLVDDLLAFSRLGRHALKREQIDSMHLIQDVLADLQEEQCDRKVDVILSDLPPCFADAHLLRQAWFNLLANALKFTRSREVATIEIGMLRAIPPIDSPENGTEAGTGQESRDKVDAYYVRDNGVGFDMRYAGKLFGVFQRLHSAESYEGTGVGLAIVQRIVSHHGGQVWAEAEVDKGATFYFTIGESHDH